MNVSLVTLFAFPNHPTWSTPHQPPLTPPSPACSRLLSPNSQAPPPPPNFSVHAGTPAEQLSPEEAAVDELLGPLFQAGLEARYGGQLCQLVFGALSRVARQCLADRPDR